MSSQRSSKDLVAYAADAGNLRTFVRALEAAGLTSALQAPGPLTVFAPTEEAFAKLAAGELDALLADREKLAGILGYHVIPRLLRSLDLRKTNGAIAATLAGPTLALRMREGRLTADRAKVVQADIATANGVLHLIDTVLVPKSADAVAVVASA
jgi:uncharacterized surface protein with fasciclin (FAS1) repeats